jgi:hypothetical protein
VIPGRVLASPEEKEADGGKAGESPSAPAPRDTRPMPPSVQRIKFYARLVCRVVTFLVRRSIRGGSGASTCLKTAKPGPSRRV